VAGLYDKLHNYEVHSCWFCTDNWLMASRKVW
jgi:hypothetical protein